MKNSIKPLACATLLIGLSFMFTGCTISRKEAHFRLIMKDDYCISNINADFPEITPCSNNPDSLVKNDSLLSSRLSQKEILVANATGLIPVIKQLFINKNFPSAGQKINAQVQMMQFQEHLLRVKSIFDELQSELNCETERTRRAAGYLDGYEKKRTNNLTIGAIFAGSVTTLVPVIVKSSAPQNSIVVGGAIISAYLGAKLLQSGHNTVFFTYERNLLSDIWSGPQVSNQYPAFIWQLMNTKELNFGNNQLSVQQNIKKRWSGIELNGANTYTLDLLFNKGGRYSEDNLQIRAVLLSQLAASLALLSSNVQSCLLSVHKKLTLSDAW